MKNNEMEGTVNVEMETGAVLVDTGGSVEEIDEARVPALVRFLDVRQIERGQSVVRRVSIVRSRLVDAEHPLRVTLVDVHEFLVPDHHRRFQALQYNQIRTHFIHISSNNTNMMKFN